MRSSLVGIVLTLALAQTAAAEDFGAPLALEKTTALSAVLADPARYSREPVQIRGRLTDVCQKKGCWTVIRDGDVQVRVRFKDYAFFLPKDATGREALAEGVVVVRTLTEQEARHYESESRNGDPDSVQGPQRRTSLLASGVRLLPR